MKLLPRATVGEGSGTRTEHRREVNDMANPSKTLREHLDRLLERAGSTDPDDALTSESPLSLEVSGKYVNVLFSTGGPHAELTAEYVDADEAEYWFDSTPLGGWFTYMDWGTRDDLYIGPWDADRIMHAVTRDPDQLSDDH